MSTLAPSLEVSFVPTRFTTFVESLCSRCRGKLSGQRRYGNRQNGKVVAREQSSSDLHGDLPICTNFAIESSVEWACNLKLRPTARKLDPCGPMSRFNWTAELGHFIRFADRQAPILRLLLASHSPLIARPVFECREVPISSTCFPVYEHGIQWRARGASTEKEYRLECHSRPTV